VALRTPTQFAEEIKINHACALTQLASLEDLIEVPSLGERPIRQISRLNLAEIVEPRYEELLMLVQAELRRSGFEDLIAAGVVICGGSSRVEGLVELAEEIFHVPVRIGMPQAITGLNEVVRNPAYATGAGLLLFGKQQHVHGEHHGSVGPGFRGMWTRMKSWFTGNF